MRVPLTQLILTTVIVATAMAFATSSPAAVPAPSCPQDVAFTYHEKWLVITASSVDEEQAKTIASQTGYCLIGKDSFLGLKPDTFVVVAAAKETRKQARAALAHVRKRHKGAYVKFGAEWCGKGEPVSAETRAFMIKAGASFSRRSFIPELETHATYWKFLAEIEGGVPVEVGAEFTQGPPTSSRTPSTRPSGGLVPRRALSTVVGS